MPVSRPSSARTTRQAPPLISTPTNVSSRPTSAKSTGANTPSRPTSARSTGRPQSARKNLNLSQDGNVSQAGMPHKLETPPKILKDSLVEDELILDEPVSKTELAPKAATTPLATPKNQVRPKQKELAAGEAIRAARLLTDFPSISRGPSRHPSLTHIEPLSPPVNTKSKKGQSPQPVMKVGALEVVGRHDLVTEELHLLTHLKEVSHCTRLCLQRIHHLPCDKILLMFPEGRFQRTRLPTVVWFLRSANAKAKQAASVDAKRIFDNFVPTLVDAAFTEDLGVLQMELPGSLHGLPIHINGFPKLSTLANLLEQQQGISSGDFEDRTDNLLDVIRHVFGVIIPRCNSRMAYEDDINLFTTYCDIQNQVLRMETSSAEPDGILGPGYFDGLGAGHSELEEECGTLNSDGVSPSEITRMVTEVGGTSDNVRLRPSQFFAKFYQQMLATSSFWKRRCIRTTSSELNLEHILYDGAGSAWLFGVDRFAKGRHIFRDLSAILCIILFVHTPITNAVDLRHLKDLVLLIASVPESFNMSLPNPPSDCAGHVRAVWLVVQEIMIHFYDYATAHGTRQRIERPDLQMMWVMFKCAVDVIPSSGTRAFPERKRLALFGATAFAHRLWSATGQITAMKWIGLHQNRWVARRSASEQKNLMMARVYLRKAGTQEAWGLEAFTGERYSRLEEIIGLTLLNDSDSWWHTSARGFPELVQLGAEKKRLVLVGGPGSGKKQAAAGLLVQYIQDQARNDRISRLPLRVDVTRLVPMLAHDVVDPLQQYISATKQDDEAASLSWEQLSPPPWPARSDFQVVVFRDELLVLGGLGENGTILNDAWSSRDSGETWEELPKPPWPARHGHQVVVFDDSLFVISGMGEQDRRLRDVWVSLDGRTWRDLPCPRWSARRHHRVLVMPLAFQDGREPQDAMVILGGNIIGDVPAQDAWGSHDGGFSWHELHKPPWPGRYGHQAIFFDGQLHVFGGIGSNHSRLHDFWTLTSSSWPRLKNAADHYEAVELSENIETEAVWKESPKPPWPARAWHSAMVFRNRLIVAGGVGIGGCKLNDCWACKEPQSWERLPTPQWRQLAASGLQLAKFHGRALLLGSKGKDSKVQHVYTSRALWLVIDGLERAGSGKQCLMRYLENFMSTEPHHHMVVTTSQSGLNEFQSHFTYWRYQQLLVKAFTLDNAHEFCQRRLVDLAPERVEEIQTEIERYGDLVTSPMTTTAVLHALLSSRGKELDACEVYQVACEQYLDTKSAGNLELDLPACELAFEMSRMSTRTLSKRELEYIAKRSESMEVFIRLSRENEIAICDFNVEGELNFINPSIHDYLAAKHVWRIVNSGEGVPPWLLKEGSGNEVAVCCSRFFGALAAKREMFDLKTFADLRESLGIILRNIARSGDQDSAGRLLKVVPERQVLLMATEMSETQLTALHVAAMVGHKGMAEKLLELAPDPVALSISINAQGYTALHCAAQNGHELVVRSLIELMPSHHQDSLIMAVVRSHEETQCPTALHLAAANGHHVVLQTLLDLSPNQRLLNHKVDVCGSTALHWAASNGQEAAVRTLLMHAKDRHMLLTTANTYEKKTAMHLAAETQSSAVVRALIEMAPDPRALLAMTDRFGQTALHLAAEKGNAASIHVMLELANEPWSLLTQREPLAGQTALHLAADFGNAEAIAALLKYAKSPSQLLASKDRCGWYTALHLACEKGRAAAARTLLELSPDRDTLLSMAERFSGQMALHLACGAGHEDVVRTLIELAPDQSALLAKTDKSGGFTALQLAVDRGHEGAVRQILELADETMPLLLSKVRRWGGFTALHLAAYNGHEAIAQIALLLAPNRNSLLVAQDSKGRTPEQLAIDRGRVKTAMVLASPDWLFMPPPPAKEKPGQYGGRRGSVRTRASSDK